MKIRKLKRKFKVWRWTDVSVQIKHCPQMCYKTPGAIIDFKSRW